MLQPGDQVPDFRLQAGTGQSVASAELRGRRWVIYFYPEDNTPGCTTETGEFGRSLPSFHARGVLVLGCSGGDVEAKARFAEACGAPDLPLLADLDHRVAELFGVWRTTVEHPEGRVKRTTFLVGVGGAIERVWETVKPAGHAAEVLAAVS